MVTKTTAAPTSRRYRTHKDDKMIAALAAGKTQKEAAQEAGMSERSVRRRMDDPNFRRRVNEACLAMYNTAIGKASAQSDQAVTTLVEILTDGDREANRLRAAQLLLGLGKEHLQVKQLQDRLTTLEDTLRTAITTVEGELA
jgi:hypothetical protein